MSSGAKLREDRGAVLMLMAGALVFLMGAAAFGVDLGWLYLNNTRIQKAADAAALAAVVHVPGDYDEAESVLLDIADRNGWTDGVNASVTWTSPVAGNDRRIKVDVTGVVDTFFLRVFGMNNVSIHQDATAEYVLPLPMGSPQAEFGTGTLGSQGFWGAIQAPYTKRQHGDPYATRCNESFDDESCSSFNAQYRPTGYYYAVEVPAGVTDLRVRVYDAGFYNGSLMSGTGDFRWPRGRQCPGCERGGTGDAGPPPTGDYKTGATTKYTFHLADSTPLDHTDNPVASAGTCGGGAWTTGQWTLSPEYVTGGGATSEDRWRTICRINGAVPPGIYPLQIQTIGTGHASSHFGIKALSSSATKPRVYGIGDMSIFANVSSGSAEFFLAEVAQVHAGKELILDFFDPGDASGNNSITILAPSGSSPACHLTVANDGISRNLDPCVINATRPSFNYNGDWLSVAITLPPDYSCGSNCWWKVRYNYSSGSVTDRTTWTARIVGDPVRLVLGGS